jgi:hypothetical protein
MALKKHSNRGDFWWSALRNGITPQEGIPFFLHLKSSAHCLWQTASGNCTDPFTWFLDITI